MVAPPKVTSQWDAAARRLRVSVRFPDGAEPQQNDLWWAVDRHPDYTLAMEYDGWESVPLRRTGAATYSGEATSSSKPQTLDFLTVHRHTANGSTLTLSSPLLYLETR